MSQGDNKKKEREYQTPVLYEYGDVSSITQAITNTSGDGTDGDTPLSQL